MNNGTIIFLLIFTIYIIGVVLTILLAQYSIRRRFRKDYLNAENNNFGADSESIKDDEYVNFRKNIWIRQWVSNEKWNMGLEKLLLRGLCIFWFGVIPVVIILEIGAFINKSLENNIILYAEKKLTKENLKNEN